MRNLERSTARAPMRDVRAVRVRGATPADGGRLEEMASRLSPETVYRRFHLPYPRVPAWMISQLVRAGDHRTRNIVAVAGGEILGHAMYVVSEDPREAEIAIVVEDAWQSRGVGKLLISELAHRAERQGVEAFTGEVLGENERPIRLLQSVLPEVRYRAGGGLYHVRASLRSEARGTAPVEGDVRRRVCA